MMTRRFLLLTACALLTAMASALTVDNLRVESFRNPTGIDLPAPHFSWQLQSNHRGVMQTSYRLVISTDADGGDVDFDSGVVSSGAAFSMPAFALEPVDDWQLVWSDEFNRDGTPDSTVWNYEHGFVRNHEAQWYQPANAYQHDGKLIIEARREQRPNPSYRPHSRLWGQQRPNIDYTSACLTTAGKYEFLYGRLEVRAKIPTAGGAWPAIWTLGRGMEWPSCGEIDVMEYYRINDVPHILANVAWGNDQRFNAVWNTKRIPYAHFTQRDPQWDQQFHVWRMDWDETAIRIYLDDELLNDVPLATTVNGSIGRHINPFTRPQYILLNLALGGDNGGTIDDTAFPMRYEIDYVRVYRKQLTIKTQ